MIFLVGFFVAVAIIFVAFIFVVVIDGFVVLIRAMAYQAVVVIQFLTPHWSCSLLAERVDVRCFGRLCCNRCSLVMRWSCCCGTVAPLYWYFLVVAIVAVFCCVN